MVSKTDEEWKKQLTPEQYDSGEYYNSKEKGVIIISNLPNELLSTFL
jgi:hypothetical protein